MGLLVLDAVTDFRILLSIGVSLYLFFSSSSWKLRHIPTAGFSGWPVVSYISLIQFALYGDDLLREYHERYQGKPFKIAHLTGWFVILNDGPDNVKEASKWSDSLVHPHQALFEAFRAELTLGKIILKDHYTAALVNNLTRHINDGDLLRVLREDFESAIEDTLQPTDEWKSYELENTSFRIVSPLVARVIAGSDLCKNQEFLDVCGAFPKQVFKTALLANAFFPSILKPLAPFILNGTTQSVHTVINIITPIVERSHLWRLPGYKMHNKENTSLDWFIRMAEGDEEEYHLESIARRILHLSLASHHTTSTTFLRVLYNLCDHPECIAPLREEAQKAIDEDGWSKPALDKMKMMESVIQETHRMMPLSNIQPVRTVLKNHMLGDGTFLPAGTGVGFRTDSIHLNSSVYQDPEQFDGFRFYNLNLQGKKNNITTPSRNLIMFGIGKHACPGRFIAATELKLFISYFLLNYDIKAGKRIKCSRLKFDIITSNPYVPRNAGDILVRKRYAYAGTATT